MTIAFFTYAFLKVQKYFAVAASILGTTITYKYMRVSLSIFNFAFIILQLPFLPPQKKRVHACVFVELFAFRNCTCTLILLRCHRSQIITSIITTSYKRVRVFPESFPNCMCPLSCLQSPLPDYSSHCHPIIPNIDFTHAMFCSVELRATIYKWRGKLGASLLVLERPAANTLWQPKGE